MKPPFEREKGPISLRYISTTGRASISKRNLVLSAQTVRFLQHHAGDLVTLPWWTQLWLNEGFATYFESMGAGYLYNQYEADSSWPQDGGMPVNPGHLNYMRSFSIDVLDVALRCVFGQSLRACFFFFFFLFLRLCKLLNLQSQSAQQHVV